MQCPYLDMNYCNCQATGHAEEEHIDESHGVANYHTNIISLINKPGKLLLDHAGCIILQENTMVPPTT